MVAGERNRRNAAEDDRRTIMPVDRNARNSRSNARNSNRAMDAVGNNVRTDPIIEFRFNSNPSTA